MEQSALLRELVNRVVRDAQPVHDYVQINFLDGSVLTLNNCVKMDGLELAITEMSCSIRTLTGHSVEDMQTTPHCFAITFSSGQRLEMSLLPEDWVGPEELTWSMPGNLWWC
jgi:hypothetical protein